MVDFGIGGISSGILGLFGSAFFWVLIFIVLFVVALIVFYVMKRKQLKYFVYEIFEVGNNKVSMIKTKAGWFGKNKMLFGLIDYGAEKQMKTAEGKIISQASTEDLHEIAGKKVFLCMRKSDDPKILVPIRHFRLTDKSQEILSSIAPSQHRDTAVDIIKEATKETTSTWATILPYLALGTIVIFFIIGVVFASQTFNHAIDKATEISAQCGSKAIASTTAP